MKLPAFLRRRAPAPISCFVAGVVKSLSQNPQEWNLTDSARWVHSSGVVIVSGWIQIVHAWPSYIGIERVVISTSEQLALKAACHEAYDNYLHRIYQEGLEKLRPAIDHFTQLGCPEGQPITD